MHKSLMTCMSTALSLRMVPILGCFTFFLHGLFILLSWSVCGSFMIRMNHRKTTTFFTFSTYIHDFQSWGIVKIYTVAVWHGLNILNGPELICNDVENILLITLSESAQSNHSVFAWEMYHFVEIRDWSKMSFSRCSVLTEHTLLYWDNHKSSPFCII